MNMNKTTKYTLVFIAGFIIGMFLLPLILNR